MKASDRALVFGVLILGMAASFWFLLLAPKRDDANALKAEISRAESAIDAQQAIVAAARAARADYRKSYKSLVVLGKAAPEQSDTPTLVTLLLNIATKAGTGFDAIKLEDSVGGAPAPAPAPAPAVKEKPEGGDAPASAPPTPAAATEAAASGLPLGATVGTAGLPVMPYTVTVSGSYFEIADFFAGVDRLVNAKGGKLVVDGRLFTVDGFSIAPPEGDGLSDGSSLVGTIKLTTYVVSPSEGAAAGATADAPATAVAAAAAAPASTPAPAASVTP